MHQVYCTTCMMSKWQLLSRKEDFPGTKLQVGWDKLSCQLVILALTGGTATYRHCTRLGKRVSFFIFDLSYIC